VLDSLSEIRLRTKAFARSIATTSPFALKGLRWLLQMAFRSGGLGNR
jgi:hypothetical protein